MKLLVIADDETFPFDESTQKVDLLISLGDISAGYILKVKRFVDAEVCLAVKGNHDLPEEFPSGVDDTHKIVNNVQRYSFGGFNGSWKYKTKGHFLYTQKECSEMLREMRKVDVFISHNSPEGIHEREIGLNDHHQGFSGIYNYILEKRPKFLFHGHQHVNRKTVVRETLVVGVYGHKFFDLKELWSDLRNHQ